MLNYLDDSPTLPMQLQQMAAMLQTFNTSVAQDLANARSGAAFLEKLSALVNSPTSVSIETVNGVVTVPSLASIAAQLSVASFEMQTLIDSTNASIQTLVNASNTSMNSLVSTSHQELLTLQAAFVANSLQSVIDAVGATIDGKINTAKPTFAQKLFYGSMT